MQATYFTIIFVKLQNYKEVTNSITLTLWETRSLIRWLVSILPLITSFQKHTGNPTNSIIGKKRIKISWVILMFTYKTPQCLLDLTHVERLMLCWSGFIHCLCLLRILILWYWAFACVGIPILSWWLQLYSQFIALSVLPVAHWLSWAFEVEFISNTK